MESILHRELDPHETSTLLRNARREGVTVNDLLLRDLFQVLSAECSGNAVDDDDCISICMPVNLRDAADAKMPAANKMMMSFLRRTPWECSEPIELLQGINDETRTIKRTKRGVRLLEVLRIAIAVSGKVPPRLLEKNSFATAVLSNLGRLSGGDSGLPSVEDGRFIAGRITVEKIITAPNGRPGTAAVFVVLTYAGRLAVSMRYEACTLSAACATKLLDAYLSQLRRTATAQQPEAVAV
jgi:hypothetical protein